MENLNSSDEPQPNRPCSASTSSDVPEVRLGGDQTDPHAETTGALKRSIASALPEASPAEDSSTVSIGQTPRQRFIRRFRQQRVGLVALGILVTIVLAAILAPLLAPYDPNAVGVGKPLESASLSHWLGTDDIGRDVLSRVLFATRLSLVAATQAVSIAVVLGLPLGLISGFVGGWVDMVIMRVNDALMAIPALILALAIVGILGPSLTNAMVAIGIVYAPRILRVTRATTLSVVQEPYVEASRSIGTKSHRIVTSHVLPNILSPLAVQVTLTTGLAVLAEAALSFLGLGAQVPDASLGSMVNRAFSYLRDAPLYVIAPGFVVMIMVLSLNLLGDAVRDSIGREVRS